LEHFIYVVLKQFNVSIILYFKGEQNVMLELSVSDKILPMEIKGFDDNKNIKMKIGVTDNCSSVQDHKIKS
jgi:hypothetical protein